MTFGIVKESTVFVSLLQKTCSIMIGTTTVPLKVSLGITCFADETPIAHTVETSRKKISSGGRNRIKQQQRRTWLQVWIKQLPLETSKPEVKEDEAITLKREKASSKPEKNDQVESQASSPEKPVKEDLKAATNEEVNQMIEDRKVN